MKNIKRGVKFDHLSGSCNLAGVNPASIGMLYGLYMSITGVLPEMSGVELKPDFRASETSWRADLKISLIPLIIIYSALALMERVAGKFLGFYVLRAFRSLSYRTGY
ncbi:MAG: hypothetical protein ACE5QV_02365 [Fidelibacterota bacterium]